MVCNLTSPSHYLNQCWLRIGGAQWQSPVGHLTRDTPAINDWKELKYYSSKIWVKYRRCQRVKQWMAGKFGISRNTVFCINTHTFWDFWLIEDETKWPPLRRRQINCFVWKVCLQIRIWRKLGSNTWFEIIYWRQTGDKPLC